MEKLLTVTVSTICTIHKRTSNWCPSPISEITFALSEELYEVIEGENVLSLTILKINEQDVILANPVFFKITPLTVCEALAQRLDVAFETDNTFSPNRAGTYLEFS